MQSNDLSKTGDMVSGTLQVGQLEGVHKLDSALVWSQDPFIYVLNLPLGMLFVAYVSK